MLEIWSLPFLNPAYSSGSSQFTYCWSLAWRILSITLLAWEVSAIVQYIGHSLASPFFGIGMKTELFQSCGPCWVFQIFWHIECSTQIVCIKLSMALFADLERKILKLETQKIVNSQSNLEKKNRMGGMSLPGFRLHYKAMVIKTVGFPGGSVVKNWLTM